MLTLSLSTSGQDLSGIKGQKPVQMSGSLQALGTTYGASGIADRRQPFSYLFTGNATLSVYGVAIPFSVAYTKSQSSFSQPFNQFGLSPTYKWITVHGGYRNIEYSPYTLGGHTMLGAGVDLSPGKLRLGFMHGRLNAATAVDSTTQALVPFSFSRTGTAARLGYGTDQNFFEFSYLQAKDDSTSVQRSQVRPQDYITPAANKVLGYSTRSTFLKYFTFEARGAFSVYTRDINSPIKLEGVNNAALKKIKNFVDINGSSEFYGAYDASLAYRSQGFGLKADYKRVEPDYKTMGAYFFNSDLESWTFGPMLNLFKNRLRVTGSVGFQHDNLMKQKRSTNHRFIGSGNAGIDLTKSIAVDVAFSNFSNDQRPNTQMFPDSLRIVQTTSNITVAPRYSIITPTLIQIFTLSVGLNQLDDFNQVITSNQTVNRSIDTKQYFFNYVVTFPQQSTSVFANVNRTQLNSEFLNSVYQGLTVGANTMVMKKKLQVGVNTSFMQSQMPSGNGLIINGSGILSYRVDRRQTLRNAFFYTNNRPPAGSSATPFSEFRNELSYVVNF